MAFQPTSSGSVSGSSASSGVQFFSSSFVDTTYTKVFVGGLAWETQSETMRRYFEHFGEILEAVVITDKNTRKSKGYGFVTFRDPESAGRACTDPSPVIDGRRANCNLASRGRPRMSPPYGSLRPASPYFGGVQCPQGAFVQNSTHHQPFSYAYQQGYAYPPYGYTAYGPEYLYPQCVYSPYMGQQYLQIYGIPGTVNTPIYPFGQFSAQPLSSGHGYTAVQGFGMPNHHIVKFGGPSVNAVTGAPIPTIQAPYSTGVMPPVPAQPQFVIPAHPPQFTLGSGSIQMTG